MNLEMDKRRGYCFRAPKSHNKAIQKMRNIETIKILTSGTLFQNDTLKESAKEHLEIIKEYEEEQKELIAKAVSVASSYRPVFDAAAGLLSELDVFLSFAYAGTVIRILFICRSSFCLRL